MIITYFLLSFLITKGKNTINRGQNLDKPKVDSKYQKLKFYEKSKTEH